MSFSKIVESRKSIRKFNDQEVPQSVIDQAIDHALLAPNSSNLQNWNFYHVKSAKKKKSLVHYCLNQVAARTASELVVITANPDLWKRSLPYLKNFTKEVEAPKAVKAYYQKIIPFFYHRGFLGIKGFLKSFLLNIKGLKAPVMRGPFTKKEQQLVSVKSAALAAQNFVLSLKDQGFDSCMMEGFDEKRVQRLLDLSSNTRIVMVIAIGKEGERATWGPRFRIPRELVVHNI